jgi:hypothetical protein
MLTLLGIYIKSKRSQRREQMYLNMHILPAKSQFGNIELRKCYWLGRVALQSGVASALESAVFIGQVDVHLFLCIFSVAVDSLQCHLGKKGIWWCGFDKA